MLQKIRGFHDRRLGFAVGDLVVHNHLDKARKRNAKRFDKLVLVGIGFSEGAKRRGVPCRIFGAGKAVELSVAEWLTIFRDAEYIITDSFHGCVFSIIFRREFAAIINRNRGASRFLSLFGKFGLLDRVVIDASRGVLPNQPIDWSVVEQKLRMWQELSLNYLAKALCR